MTLAPVLLFVRPLFAGGGRSQTGELPRRHRKGVNVGMRKL